MYILYLVGQHRAERENEIQVQKKTIPTKSLVIDDKWDDDQWEVSHTHKPHSFNGFIRTLMMTQITPLLTTPTTVDGMISLGTILSNLPRKPHLFKPQPLNLPFH